MVLFDELENGNKKRDAINDLDCIVCGNWFPTFDRLARHMAARHGRPTPNDPGMVELPAATGRVRASFPERRYKRMAKKSARKPAGKSGSIPAPRKSENTGDYNPFLKSSDVGDLGETARLILQGKVRVADSGFGEQVITEVKYQGKTYDWGFKVDGGNHRRLHKRFGANERNWKGPVSVTVKEYNGNPYIAVDNE